MRPPVPILLADTDSILQGSNKSLNFFQDGRFYLYGDFDGTISTEVVPHLVQQIEAKRSQRDAKISFYIGSHGGNGFEAMKLIALFEQAKAAGIVIETYVFSHAYSAGSLIACAGSPGHRYIGPFAEHLCHLSRTGTGMIVNDVELERTAARAKFHLDFVRDIYRKYAKIRELEKAIHDDCWFIRGEDIIRNGLADKML